VNLQEYYGDLRAKRAELERKYPSGEVFVTSLFHRERNSTAGAVCSATLYNAARVITDGTHREATKEEIDLFLQHQQDQLRRNTAAEQATRKQFIVVLDKDNLPATLTPPPPAQAQPATGKPQPVGAK